MKISQNWLNDYIETTLSSTEIGDILTSTGLEVEALTIVESIKGGLEKFFIGEVISCQKHPNADKLSLTVVNLGSDLGTRNIVCGAPNVAAGQRVVVATEGAIIYLPSGETFTIKNAKIRGEESQGMICAEDEIGTGSSHDGILVLSSDATVGMTAAQYFRLSSDTVFEIGLTPNRTDAMSHRGVARDLAAALTSRNISHQYFPNGKLVLPELNASLESAFQITMNSEDATVFSHAVLDNITNGSSPSWIQDRLKAIDEHPKSLLVDLINYILHDLGQPLHAYDAAKLSSNHIEIRSANSSEKWKALNNQSYNIQEQDLIISSGSDTIGLAGIMGSESTAVSEYTTRIVLEAAYFNGKRIRQTSQRLQLRSEASSKFEKGIDPLGSEVALTRAIQILSSVLPTVTYSNIESKSTAIYSPFEVFLNSTTLETYANTSLNSTEVENILTSLGIEILIKTDSGWQLSIPRFKADVTREVDVIEEILRIYGFNNLPYPPYLKSSLSFTQGITRNAFESKVSNFLASRGSSEIMTNAISQSRYFPDKKVVKLLNSMTSELDCMRPDMMPGILEVISYNLNRDQKDLRFHEFGNCYFTSDTGNYKQSRHLTIASTGQFQTANWQNTKGSPNDYFQLKSLVENLLAQFDIDYTYSEDIDTSIHYGLIINSGNRRVGSIGAFRVDSQFFDIKQPVFATILDMDVLYSLIQKQTIRYQEVSKFPQVKRDLAMILDIDKTFALVESLCFRVLGSSLTKVSLFDVYQGEGIGQNKKSYAIRIFIEPKEKTLEDKEIDSMLSKLIRNLESNLGAEIRK